MLSSIQKFEEKMRNAEMKSFFVEKDINDGLVSLIQILQHGQGESRFSKEALSRLAAVLSVIRDNPISFDEACITSISRFGETFRLRLINIKAFPISQELNLIWSLTYHFMVEYDLSNIQKLSDIIQDFVDYTAAHLDELPEFVREHVDIANRKVPILMLKNLFADQRIENMQSLPGIAQKIADKIDVWNKELQQKESKIDALKASLDLLKTDFNFVSLKEGFERMLRAKKAELKRTGRWVLGFGILMVCPVAYELHTLSGLKDKWSEVNQIWLGATALLSLSLSMFLVYFFRIALRNFDSCSAQIMQIDLRMTLCQFVQDYAEYAEDIKKKSPETLSKFESIVFSPISSADAINLSFIDGLEQISSFVKAVKGKSD